MNRIAKFYKVSKEQFGRDCYENIVLPTRATAGSAGYDFTVAEDVVIPSYLKLVKEMFRNRKDGVYSLEEMAKLTKSIKAKPTLVPTGIKCYLDKNQYLELSVRSSCPLKYWLILANGVGIIDSDYVDNPDNEGHIMAKITNDSNEGKTVEISAGMGFIQGIFLEYGITTDDDAQGVRNGGFGSTTK